MVLGLFGSSTGYGGGKRMKGRKGMVESRRGMGREQWRDENREREGVLR